MTRAKRKISSESLAVLQQMLSEQQRIHNISAIALTSREKLSQMIAEDRIAALEEVLDLIGENPNGN